MNDVDTEKLGDLRRGDKSGYHRYERTDAERTAAEAENLFEIHVSSLGRFFPELLDPSADGIDRLFQAFALSGFCGFILVIHVPPLAVV